MEKKNLGRELEQISQIFLSSTQNDFMDSGIRSVPPDPERCHSGSAARSKGRAVDLDLLDQETPDKQSGNQDRDPYDDFFEEDAASSETSNAPGVGPVLTGADILDAMCEVEETVTVQKKISYPGSPDAQQKLIRLLCQHLEEGFSIREIQLNRAESRRQPGRCNQKEETITIHVEEPPPLAGM